MKIGKQNVGSFVSKDNDKDNDPDKLKDLINEITKVANYIEKRKAPASYIVLPASLIRPYEDAIDKERE